MPLGINAGGVALPLRIKRVELRAIFGGGGIGPGDAVIIQGQVDPVGHDGHRTLHFKVFAYAWQPEWRRLLIQLNMKSTAPIEMAVSASERYHFEAVQVENCPLHSLRRLAVLRRVPQSAEEQ